MKPNTKEHHSLTNWVCQPWWGHEQMPEQITCMYHEHPVKNNWNALHQSCRPLHEAALHEHQHKWTWTCNECEHVTNNRSNRARWLIRDKPKLISRSHWQSDLSSHNDTAEGRAWAGQRCPWTIVPSQKEKWGRCEHSGNPQQKWKLSKTAK